jgi:hypothetical protein
MKAFVLLYLAEFFLEWEMFQTKVVETKHTFYVQQLFFSDSLAEYEIMCKKYDRAGQTADDIKVGRMRFACLIFKANMQAHTRNIW